VELVTATLPLHLPEGYCRYLSFISPTCQFKSRYPELGRRRNNAPDLETAWTEQRLIQKDKCEDGGRDSAHDSLIRRCQILAIVYRYQISHTYSRITERMNT
jgi:hypothetical protein